MGLVGTDAPIKGVEDTLPSCLQWLLGPPFPLPISGSSFSSAMGTSLLLTAPLFCQPPAPPRRQLPITPWCTTCTVITSSDAGSQTRFDEAESALSAETTVSLQQMLTSAQQQQQATLSSPTRQNSQPVSSPEELLSRLNSGQLDSGISSGSGRICGSQADSSLYEGSIDIIDDAASSLLTM